jgi:hypothetical protein
MVDLIVGLGLLAYVGCLLIWFNEEDRHFRKGRGR